MSHHIVGSARLAFLISGEGPRLVVEQHVALLADVFIGSGRSAVSQMVFQARGHRYGQIASRTDPRRRQYL
eukprot:803877-Pleurochrysis_carterae.AAC.2